MTDLLHGNPSGLESPLQRVLDGLGIINLRFNILVRPLAHWQYSPFHSPIMICSGPIILRLRR